MSKQKTDNGVAIESNPLLACPFCHETDFDLIGLKRHLLVTGCDVFEVTELWDSTDHTGNNTNKVI
jgi:hypothetical protein